MLLYTFKSYSLKTLVIWFSFISKCIPFLLVKSPNYLTGTRMMLKLIYFHLDVLTGISNLSCPNWTPSLPYKPIPITVTLNFQLLRPKIPWTTRFLSHTSCITQVSNSCGLFLQNIARIWPFPSNSTATSRDQASIFACLNHYNCLLNDLPCLALAFRHITSIAARMVLLK